MAQLAVAHPALCGYVYCAKKGQGGHDCIHGRGKKNDACCNQRCKNSIDKAINNCNFDGIFVPADSNNPSVGQFPRDTNGWGRCHVHAGTCANQLKPKPWYAELPVFETRSEMMEQIRKNRVVLVQGATGCGKTVGLPPFLIEQALHDKTRLNCYLVIPNAEPASKAYETQRNLLPCKMLEPTDVLISYRLGEGKFKGPKPEHSMIKTCTFGYLIKKIMHSGYLKGKYDENYDETRKFTHLVLDEIHQRSADSDKVLLFAKRLLERNEQLKLILVSATVNVEMYRNYFESFGFDALKPIENKTLPNISYVYAGGSPGGPGNDNATCFSAIDYYSKGRELDPNGLAGKYFGENRFEISNLERCINEETRRKNPNVFYGKISDTGYDNFNASQRKLAVKIAITHVVYGIHEELIKDNLIKNPSSDGSHDGACAIIFVKGKKDAYNETDKNYSLRTGQGGLDEKNGIMEAIVFELVSRGFKYHDFRLTLYDNVKNQNLEFAPVVELWYPDPNPNKFKLEILYKDGQILRATDEADKELKRNTVRIFLCTNAVESSITLDRLDTVICLGSKQENKFHNLVRKSILTTKWISKASAIQRAGRTGRKQPLTTKFGCTVFRLYSQVNMAESNNKPEDDNKQGPGYKVVNLPNFSDPEMKSENLDNFLVAFKTLMDNGTITDKIVKLVEGDKERELNDILGDMLDNKNPEDVLRRQESFKYLHDNGIVSRLFLAKGNTNQNDGGNYDGEFTVAGHFASRCLSLLEKESKGLDNDEKKLLEKDIDIRHFKLICYGISLGLEEECIILVSVLVCMCARGSLTFKGLPEDYVAYLKKKVPFSEPLLWLEYYMDCVVQKKQADDDTQKYQQQKIQNVVAALRKIVHFAKIDDNLSKDSEDPPPPLPQVPMPVYKPLTEKDIHHLRLIILWSSMNETHLAPAYDGRISTSESCILQFMPIDAYGNAVYFSHTNFIKTTNYYCSFNFKYEGAGEFRDGEGALIKGIYHQSGTTAFPESLLWLHLAFSCKYKEGAWKIKEDFELDDDSKMFFSGYKEDCCKKFRVAINKQMMGYYYDQPKPSNYNHKEYLRSLYWKAGDGPRVEHKLLKTNRNLLGLLDEIFETDLKDKLLLRLSSSSSSSSSLFQTEDRVTFQGPDGKLNEGRIGICTNSSGEPEYSVKDDGDKQYHRVPEHVISFRKQYCEFADTLGSYSCTASIIWRDRTDGDKVLVGLRECGDKLYIDALRSVIDSGPDAITSGLDDLLDEMCSLARIDISGAGGEWKFLFSNNCRVDFYYLTHKQPQFISTTKLLNGPVFWGDNGDKGNKFLYFNTELIKIQYRNPNFHGMIDGNIGLSWVPLESLLSVREDNFNGNKIYLSHYVKILERIKKDPQFLSSTSSADRGGTGGAGGGKR